MTNAYAGPPRLPLATEEQVRSHAAELIAMAAEHGITELAFASTGRLRGHVADGRDMVAVFDFRRDAEDLLGAEFELFSDGVLGNERVSPDLIEASPL